VRTIIDESSLLRFGEGFQENSMYKSSTEQVELLTWKGRIQYRIKRENPK